MSHLKLVHQNSGSELLFFNAKSKPQKLCSLGVGEGSFLKHFKTINICKSDLIVSSVAPQL